MHALSEWGLPGTRSRAIYAAPRNGPRHGARASQGPPRSRDHPQASRTNLMPHLLRPVLPGPGPGWVNPAETSAEQVIHTPHRLQRRHGTPAKSAVPLGELLHFIREFHRLPPAGRRKLSTPRSRDLSARTRFATPRCSDDPSVGAAPVESVSDGNGGETKPQKTCGAPRKESYSAVSPRLNLRQGDRR
jgi:hypothetical protein